MMAMLIRFALTQRLLVLLMVLLLSPTCRQPKLKSLLRHPA